MAKKIVTTNEKIGLGFFSLPILEFNERFEEITKNNPQLTPVEAAAVVYFGMCADTPIPTKNTDVYAVKWADSGIPVEQWLGSEYNQRYYAVYSGMHPPFVIVDAQTGYLNNVKVLQTWLAYNGLYEGVEKTLTEESRKLQAQAAAASASAQAAAYALAMSRITDDMTEQARVEAAQRQADAQKQYNAAIEQENRTREQLDRISKGLPPESPGVSVGAVFAIGTAVAVGAYLIGRRG